MQKFSCNGSLLLLSSGILSRGAVLLYDFVGTIKHTCSLTTESRMAFRPPVQSDWPTRWTWARRSQTEAWNGIRQGNAKSWRAVMVDFTWQLDGPSGARIFGQTLFCMCLGGCFGWDERLNWWTGWHPSVTLLLALREFRFLRGELGKCCPEDLHWWNAQPQI